MNILQIGCNTGNDHVLEYVKNNQSNIDKIVLVDASLESINKCKITYANIPNCTFVHGAVVTDNSESVELFVPSYDYSSEHASMNFDHLVQHNHGNINKISVPAINILKLLDQYQPIDRLYIDTEGWDAKIVNSIDFNKHKIPYILFEYIHSDGPGIIGSNFKKAVKTLLEYNYKVGIILETNIEASLT